MNPFECTFYEKAPVTHSAVAVPVKSLAFCTLNQTSVIQHSFKMLSGELKSSKAGCKHRDKSALYKTLRRGLPQPNICCQVKYIKKEKNEDGA